MDETSQDYWTRDGDSVLETIHLEERTRGDEPGQTLEKEKGIGRREELEGGRGFGGRGTGMLIDRSQSSHVMYHPKPSHLTPVSLATTMTHLMSLSM